MDLIQSNVFWTDVGLAVASKLAIVAAMLWVLKMAIEARKPVRADSPRMTFEAVAVAQPAPRPRFRETDVDEAVAGVAEPRSRIESRTLARPVVRESVTSDHKRDELLAFIAQRTQGRGHDERQ